MLQSFDKTAFIQGYLHKEAEDGMSFQDMYKRSIYPSATEDVAKTLDNIVHKIRTDPDLPANWVPGVEHAARHVVSKRNISKDQLKAMGYKPSLIAVPEVGQAKWTTWRHPRNTLHLHDYGGEWLTHVDNKPSASMSFARFLEDRRLRKTNKGATTQRGSSPLQGAIATSPTAYNGIVKGVRHVWEEGVPEYIGYLNKVLMGVPGFDKYVKVRMEGKREGGDNKVLPDYFTETNWGKAIPRIGLLIGAFSAIGAGMRGATSKGSREQLPVEQRMSIPATRASETAIGALEGAGAGSGFAAATALMPWASSMLRDHKVPVAIRSALYLSILTGMTLGGKYAGKKTGEHLFLTPGQRRG